MTFTGNCPNKRFYTFSGLILYIWFWRKQVRMYSIYRLIKWEPWVTKTLHFTIMACETTVFNLVKEKNIKEVNIQISKETVRLA